MNSVWSFVARFSQIKVLAQISLLAVTLLTLSGMGAAPLSDSAVFTDLLGFGLIGPIALGLGVVLILGEFDLSVASMVALSAVVTAELSGKGFVICLLCSLVLCLVLGLAQGAIIAGLGINSIVVTLGSSFCLVGLAQIPSDSTSVIVADLAITDPMSRSWSVFTPPSIIALSIFAVAALFLRFHRSGRTLYALGGGRSEAREAGLARGKYVVATFGFSGLMAGLSGAMSTLTSGSAVPTGFGLLLIQGIAAALIGGVALAGGRGTVLGVALGVLVIQVLVNGMNSLAVPYFQVNFFLGLLLFTFVAVQCVASFARTHGLETPKQLVAGVFRLLSRPQGGPISPTVGRTR